MHLLACRACHRQYDVSHLEPGDHVRCACEELLTVKNPHMLNVHAMRCAHCGAPVSAQDETCGHCTARLSAASRLATTLCPECFTRLEESARVCSHCAVEISPNRLSALPHGTVCPRCEGELANRFLGDWDLIECQACQGVWVTPEIFDRLCTKSSQNASSLAPARSRVVVVAPDVVAYVPCVQCSQLMTRRQFQWSGRSAGVVIDLCREHGIWLDAGELRRVLDFVKTNACAAPMSEGYRRQSNAPMPDFEAPLPMRRELGLWALALDALSDLFHFEIS
ncbi:MAG: hypothetical protein GY711_08390 [bacterium]|nr:hypothetical protein [bacterium]